MQKPPKPFRVELSGLPDATPSSTLFYMCQSSADGLAKLNMLPKVHLSALLQGCSNSERHANRSTSKPSPITIVILRPVPAQTDLLDISVNFLIRCSMGMILFKTRTETKIPFTIVPSLCRTFAHLLGKWNLVFGCHVSAKLIQHLSTIKSPTEITSGRLAIWITSLLYIPIWERRLAVLSDPVRSGSDLHRPRFHRENSLARDSTCYTR